MSYNSKELKVKYEGDGKLPKKKRKNPNVAAVSRMGYRDDSPYRSLPYIDIHTPNGTIDMSATGIPLLANGRVLPPYSGTHQFDTDTVREIPLAQKGREMKQMLDKISPKKKLPKVPKSELILKDDLLFPTDEADVPIPYEYPMDADIYFKNLQPAQWFIDRENWRKENPQPQFPMEVKKGGWLKDYKKGSRIKRQEGGDMPFGMPLKEVNPFTVAEYRQPMMGNFILPDPNRPELMNTRATEYKIGIDTDEGELQIPTVVSGQYIGPDNAVERAFRAREAFLPMTDPSSYSKFYQMINRLGIMKQKKGGQLKKYQRAGQVRYTLPAMNPLNKHARNAMLEAIDQFMDSETEWEYGDSNDIYINKKGKKPMPQRDWQNRLIAQADSSSTYNYTQEALSVFDDSFDLSGKEAKERLKELSEWYLENRSSKIKPVAYKTRKDKEGTTYKIPVFAQPVGNVAYKYYPQADIADRAVDMIGDFSLFLNRTLPNINIDIDFPDWWGRLTSEGATWFSGTPTPTPAPRPSRGTTPGGSTPVTRPGTGSSYSPPPSRPTPRPRPVPVDTRKPTIVKPDGSVTSRIEPRRDKHGFYIDEPVKSTYKVTSTPVEPMVPIGGVFATQSEMQPAPNPYPTRAMSAESDEDIMMPSGQRISKKAFIKQYGKAAWDRATNQGRYKKQGGSKLPSHLPEAYKKGGWLKKYQTGSETGFIGPEEEQKPGVARVMGTDQEGTPVLRPTTGYYLPEVNISAERPDTYNNYILNKYKDAGLGETMFMLPMDYAFGYPQAAMTKLFSGKYQLPSEAMGIENPIGSILTDAVLDPANLVGAGLFSKERALSNAGIKAVEEMGLPALRSMSLQEKAANKLSSFFWKMSKIPTSPDVQDHLMGLAYGIYDIGKGRPVFETFPLTKSQKAKVWTMQDKAFAEGERFIRDWFYDRTTGEFRPQIEKKIQDLFDGARQWQLRDQDMFIDHPDNPLRRVAGKLVSSRTADLKDAVAKGLLDENDVREITRMRTNAGGFVTGAGDKNYTYRNYGLYHITPESVSNTATHELAHIAQKRLGRQFDIFSPTNTIADGWRSSIDMLDYDVTPYYFANPFTRAGSIIGSVMTEPKRWDLQKQFDDIFTQAFPNETFYDVKKRVASLGNDHPDSKKFQKVYDDFSNWKKNNRDKYYTWEASPMELHSETMVARKALADQLYKDANGTVSYDQVLDAIRNPTDELLNHMTFLNYKPEYGGAESLMTRDFFRPIATGDQRRAILRMLPAFGGAGLLYGVSKGQPEGDTPMYKKGGWLKKYQPGGGKDKGYYVSNTPYVQGTDWSEGQVPADYWAGATREYPAAYVNLPTIDITAERPENNLLPEISVVAAAGLAALAGRGKAKPILRKMRMDLKTLAKPSLKTIYEPQTGIQKLASKGYWTKRYLQDPRLFLEHTELNFPNTRLLPESYRGMRRPILTPRFMNMDPSNANDFFVQTPNGPLRLGKNGFDPQDAGAFNSGVFYLKDFPGHVIKIDNWPYNPGELESLIDRLKGVKIKRLAQPVKATQTPSGKTMVISKKVPFDSPLGYEGGKKSNMIGLRYFTKKDFDKVPDKALDDLVQNIDELAKRGVYVDYAGPNVVYDKTLKRFVIYDPGVAPDPNSYIGNINMSGQAWITDILANVPNAADDKQRKQFIKNAIQEYLLNESNQMNPSITKEIKETLKNEFEADKLRKNNLFNEVAKDLHPFGQKQLLNILKHELPKNSFQLNFNLNRQVLDDIQNQIDMVSIFSQSGKPMPKVEEFLIDPNLIQEFRKKRDVIKTDLQNRIQRIKKKGGATGNQKWLNAYQKGGQLQAASFPTTGDPELDALIKENNQLQLETKKNLASLDIKPVGIEEPETPEYLLSRNQITKEQYDKIYDIEYHPTKPDVVNALYDKEGNILYHSGLFGTYTNPQMTYDDDMPIDYLPTIEVVADKTPQQRLKDFTKAFPGYAASMMVGGLPGMMLWGAYNKAKGNISEMNTAGGYDIPLTSFAKAAIGMPDESDIFTKNEPVSMPVATESDAFKIYLGQDQVNGSFEPSQYEKGAYQIRGYDQFFPERIETFPDKKTVEHVNKDKNKRVNEFKPWGDYVMGKHQIKTGEDKKGKYVEYYDLWDLDTYKLNNVPVGTMIDKTVGKPFPIRGRVYYKKDPKTGEYVREDLLKKKGGVIRKNRK